MTARASTGRLVAVDLPALPQRRDVLDPFPLGAHGSALADGQRFWFKRLPSQFVTRTPLPGRGTPFRRSGRSPEIDVAPPLAVP